MEGKKVETLELFERELKATIATDHRECRRTLAPLLDTENYTPRIISPGEADI